MLEILLLCITELLQAHWNWKIEIVPGMGTLISLFSFPTFAHIQIYTHILTHIHTMIQSHRHTSYIVAWGIKQGFLHKYPKRDHYNSRNGREAEPKLGRDLSTVECRLNLGMSDCDFAPSHFSRISKLRINLLNLGWFKYTVAQQVPWPWEACIMYQG